MTVVEILRAAREKISNPEHWTTQDFAKDSSGMPVRWSSDRAVCWCALGAIRASAPSVLEAFSAEDVLDKAVRFVSPATDGVPELNDQVGHAAVMQAFDTAIAKAEGN
jgi:hypothetical protein